MATECHYVLSLDCPMDHTVAPAAACKAGRDYRSPKLIIGDDYKGREFICISKENVFETLTFARNVYKWTDCISG